VPPLSILLSLRVDEFLLNGSTAGLLIDVVLFIQLFNFFEQRGKVLRDYSPEQAATRSTGLKKTPTDIVNGLSPYVNKSP